MGQRRKARERALEILYGIEIKKSHIDETKDILLQYWSKKESENIPIADDSKSFTSNLVNGVIENINNIDECIKKYTINWTVDRISKIDKNILRIAVYEFLYLSDIPEIVSINEAVDIAKKYGSEESDKFINGILDKIRKNIKQWKNKK